MAAITHVRLLGPVPVAVTTCRFEDNDPGSVAVSGVDEDVSLARPVGSPEPAQRLTMDDLEYTTMPD